MADDFGDDDWGNFESFDDSAPAAVAKETISPPTINENGANGHAAATPALEDDGFGDADDWGDFEDADEVAPVVVEEAKVSVPAPSNQTTADIDFTDDDFGDFDAAPIVKPTLPVVADGLPAEQTVAEDDFGDFDAAPVVESTTVVAENGEGIEADDDFGDFDAAPIADSKPDDTVVANESAAVVEDDFGDFGDFEEAEESPAAPVVDELPVSSAAPDADLRGFEEPSPVVGNEPVVDDESEVFVPSGTPIPVAANDDEGDFGSFEDAEPMEMSIVEGDLVTDVPAEVLGDDMFPPSTTFESASSPPEDGFGDFNLPPPSHVLEEPEEPEFGSFEAPVVEEEPVAMVNNEDEKEDFIPAPVSPVPIGGGPTPGNDSGIQLISDNSPVTPSEVVQSQPTSDSMMVDDDMFPPSFVSPDSSPEMDEEPQLLPPPQVDAGGDVSDEVEPSTPEEEEENIIPPPVEPVPVANVVAGDDDIQLISEDSVSPTPEPDSEPTAKVEEDVKEDPSATSSSVVHDRSDSFDTLSEPVSDVPVETPVEDLVAADNPEVVSADVAGSDEKANTEEVSVEDNEVGDFGDFDTASPLDGGKESILSPNPTPVPTVEDGDDDGFGDFVEEAASEADNNEPVTMEDGEFGDFDATPGRDEDEEGTLPPNPTPIPTAHDEASDNDEFGDFDEAPIEQNTTVDDSFGEFDAAPADKDDDVPITLEEEKVPVTTTTTTTTTTSSDGFEEDDFGDFDAAPRLDEDEEGTLSPNPTPIPSTHDDGGGDSDDFGDFDAAPIEQNTTVDDSFGDFNEAAGSVAEQVPDGPTVEVSEDKEIAEDDFGDFDDPSVLADEEGVPSPNPNPIPTKEDGVDGGDDEFGDFDEAPVAEVDEKNTQVVPPSEDDFGDFDEVPVAEDKPLETEATGADDDWGDFDDTAPVAAVEETNDNDDDGWGDFDETPDVPVASDEKVDTAEGNDGDEDGWGDFGDDDFESPSAAAAAESQPAPQAAAPAPVPVAASPVVSNPVSAGVLRTALLKCVGLPDSTEVSAPQDPPMNAPDLSGMHQILDVRFGRVVQDDNVLIRMDRFVFKGSHTSASVCKSMNMPFEAHRGNKPDTSVLFSLRRSGQLSRADTGLMDFAAAGAEDPRPSPSPTGSDSFSFNTGVTPAASPTSEQKHVAGGGGDDNVLSVLEMFSSASPTSPDSQEVAGSTSEAAPQSATDFLSQTLAEIGMSDGFASFGGSESNQSLGGQNNGGAASESALDTLRGLVKGLPDLSYMLSVHPSPASK